jgi:chromate transporter
MNEPGEKAVAIPAAVPLREATRYWFQLGCTSFGGPAGQIAMMHAELVERRRWISERRFLHALNYCMVLPGPEAQQLATYIGWLMHGVWGGVIAGGLFVLPSLLLLVGLTWLYLAFGTVPVIAGMLWGIKPAVVAIVAFAAYRIGSRALRNPVLWALAAASLGSAALLQIPFPLIVLSAAAIGFIGGKIRPQDFQSGGAHSAAADGHGPALIDDETPTPAHAIYKPARLVAVLLAGAVLWIAAMLAIWQVRTLVDMGWFFSKAALLTFGGAYAVLPYVFQGSVITHGWLNASQMMDGLALGESTPGPLIMIVTFVGFVGGWNSGVFGAEHVVLGGVVAACVATYFTFLPSFIFILAGGPMVERTHDDLRFTAPLTAITAAVVGVILNLAFFFAYHVFWPAGFGPDVDWLAVVISAAAFVALYRYKAGIIKTLGVCAAIGVVTRLVA